MLARAYESWKWKKLSEVDLEECFDRVSTDEKENIPFELLNVFLPTICDGTRGEVSVMLVSEVLL